MGDSEREFYVNVLVVSSDERSGDNILSTVELKNVQYNNSAKVVCDGIMYANCNAVTFHTKDKFCRFLRTATVEEMKAVDDMLCSALGIERTTGTTGITDVLNAECEKLKERNENQRETIENLMAENQLLRDKNKEVAKYEKESDLYKDLYEFALGKLMTER